MSSHPTNFTMENYKQLMKYWGGNGENSCLLNYGHNQNIRDVFLYMLRDLKKYLELMPKGVMKNQNTMKRRLK